MFFIPAFSALIFRPVAAYNSDGTIRGKLDGAWIMVGATLTILIGFRFEVGGDWDDYLSHINDMASQDYAYALARPEFAHWVVNKFMSDAGLGITGVNLLYALIFTSGLIAFACVQPRPWLAIACAIPYLVIVVSMGYSRQSVAIGFLFFGLVALRRGRFVRFSLWVLMGATFHNPVVLLIPIAGFFVASNHILIFSITGLVSYIGYEYLLAEKLEELFNVYIEQRLMSSPGASVRLAMNALAGCVFLYYRRVFSITNTERRLWSIVSLVSIAMLMALFATGLSTALDRMALYFIPLQLMTAAHLPDVFGRSGRKNTVGVFVILTFFLVVQFIWLNFANNAKYWLPYKIGIAQ